MINRYLNRRPSWRYVPNIPEDKQIKQPEKPIKMKNTSKKLVWTKSYDAYNHPVYEAPSPFSSDGESVDIYWRIKKDLINFKLWYFADSDSECPHITVIGSLRHVKAAIQEKHDEIIAYYKQQQEAKSEHKYNLNINNS